MFDLRQRSLFWKSQLLQQDPFAPTSLVAVTQILNDWLAELADNFPQGPANRLPSSEIWSVAKDLLSRGWLQNRARTKPRGYAGDYELFVRICDQIVCDDPWGRVFDHYFLAQAAPIAVRERTHFVGQTLAERVIASATLESEFKFVSIGCGPARDLQIACQSLHSDHRQRIQAILIDLDPAALEYAQASLKEFLPPTNLVLERQNLLKVPGNKAITGLCSGSSLTSCTGFFDYLRDDEAIKLLRFMDSTLGNGGRGIVFHMSPDNPTRPYMEWIANWYLNYRTREELLVLASQATLPSEARIISLVDGLALGLVWDR